MSKRSRGQAMLDASKKLASSKKLAGSETTEKSATPGVKKSNRLPSEEKHDKFDADKQKSRLGSLHRTFDIVLNHFQKKGRVATWSMLKERAEGFSSSRVTLDDIALLLMVDPSAYVLSWQNVASDREGAHRTLELCFAFDKSVIGKSLYEEKREKEFRELLDKRFQEHPDEMQTIDTSVIPARPSEDNTATESIERKLGSSKSLGIMAHRNSIYEDSQLLLTGGLEGLRELVMKRETSNQRIEEELRGDQEAAQRRSRLQAMVTLCDGLRSAFVSSHKNSMLLKELLELLSLQMFITKQEALVRVNMLSAVTPEFFQILRADAVVPHTTVRINLQVPYGNLRKKLQNYVNDNLLTGSDASSQMQIQQ